MRISYPEAERMGWNYEDVYLFAFSELDYLTTELKSCIIMMELMIFPAMYCDL